MSTDKRRIVLGMGEGREIHMKRRFRSTALSRLNERAPNLTEQLTNIILDPARRAKLEDHIDRVQGRADIAEGVMIASFEMARVPVEELHALHDFCIEVTDQVKGFIDPEGDPVVWKNLDQDQCREFYDYDVIGAVKVNMYLFAYTLKNGIDPKPDTGEPDGPDEPEADEEPADG